MRQALVWRCILPSFAALCLGLALAGCARYPSDGSPQDIPPVLLTTQITLSEPVNPAYYYYFAVNTDGNDTHGPVPVVTTTGAGTTGWGTITGLGPNQPITEPPFFVLYNAGAFQVYRHAVDGQLEALGRPFFAELSPDQQTLTVQIDARTLVPSGVSLPSTLQVNWITLKDLTVPPENAGILKEFDAFGTGYDFLSGVRLDQNASYFPGDDHGTADELPNDTTDTGAIDIVGWQVSVAVRSPL